MYLDIILETIQKGGTILYVIFFLTLYGWYLMINKFRALQLYKEDCPQLVFGYQKRAIASGPKKATAWLKQQQGDFSTLLIQFTRKGYTRRDMEFLYLELESQTMTKIRKNNGTIAVIASVCPLLGLLGTVMGMVKTFDVIHLFGAANPMLMADGISEALITTQAGLLASFPLLLILTLLRAKGNRIFNNLKKGFLQFININSKGDKHAA